MDLIRFAIKEPVAVLVGVILVVLFGVLALLRMPYQLSPSVVEPEIAVTTNWTGATPYEIEREIIEEQEKVLKGIPGLIEMESESFNNSGTVTLRFKIGTRVDDALLRVSNKLNEVPSYPENADKPVINATGAATSPVVWMIFRTYDDNPQAVHTYRTFFENEVRQYLERVPGVADLFVGGGVEKEMHIVVDAHKLSAYALTISDLVRILRAENANVSAGSMGVGRRDYRIRTVAEFSSPEDIEQLVLLSTGQQQVTVADVARVRFGYAKLTTAMMHNNREGFAIGVKPQPGINVLEMTNHLEEVVRWLNENRLQREKVYLDWVYDQRGYINGSIQLVKEDILIGGILAVAMLLLFLRNLYATVVAATVIPISVIGTFIFMDAMGRSLNVISLAGISFAVGMFVDNAIVVLDNIDRHRQMGKTASLAAYDGTREVWGAILAGTLTNMAVFLPVVFVEEEAGQLFKDIAIAVSWALLISIFVSVLVIPMLANQLFAFMRTDSRRAEPGALARAGDALVEGYMFLVRLATANWKSRLVTIGLMTSFSIGVSFLLFPKMEYLPQGNRNLVINILIPPPGLSYRERREIGEYLFTALGPHFRQEREGLPGIEQGFYVGAENIMLCGGISSEEQRAGELVPLFMRVLNSIPGVFGVSSQAGIFETRLGRGRTIDVDLRGNDLNRVVQVGGVLFGLIKREIPFAQIRPIPSLELLYPEVRLIPMRDRVRAVGMSADETGLALDVLMDGRKIGDFKQEGEKKIDLVLKASEEDFATPEALYQALIVAPHQRIVPVSSLTKLERTAGITQIRHLERQRTVTLQVTPPAEMALQEAMETIDEKLIPALRSQGLLEQVDVRMSGVADKLTETRQVLQWDFFLAALITYLLMVALFGSFLYPLVIMFTVPLAAAGGFIGLKLVNVFIHPQPMDILTMLGFVILIGVVINNAILIVHQALNNIRDYGMAPAAAVLESTRTRLRPIYMSAFVSIFGMLPLVVAPGPGSELYRGLGSVLLGGLALSTVLTVFVTPALLMFFIHREKPQAEKT
jgi:HAE1 family hydrophobic/amphiphilic exporter-1